MGGGVTSGIITGVSETLGMDNLELEVLVAGGTCGTPDRGSLS